MTAGRLISYRLPLLLYVWGTQGPRVIKRTQCTYTSRMQKQNTGLQQETEACKHLPFGLFPWNHPWERRLSPVGCNQELPRRTATLSGSDLHADSDETGHTRGFNSETRAPRSVHLSNAQFYRFHIQGFSFQHLLIYGFTLVRYLFVSREPGISCYTCCRGNKVRLICYICRHVTIIWIAAIKKIYSYCGWQTLWLHFLPFILCQYTWYIKT